MFNDLATGLFLSKGKLCDEDCIALFSKYNLKIINNTKVIIEGKRNKNDLWDVLLNHPCPDTKSRPSTLTARVSMANGIIRKIQTKKELVQYLSASLLGTAN